LAPLEIPGLADFLNVFEKSAKSFKWRLDNGGKWIRTTIEGHPTCPLLCVAHTKSNHGKNKKDQYVPSNHEMIALAGVNDRVAAVVVHNADLIGSSRYYDPEIRRRLMVACSIKELDDVTAPVEAKTETYVKKSEENDEL